MQTSRKLSHALLALFALVVMAASAFAQGAAYPQQSAVSDQKAGSVLFYNYYTSDAANPGARNTRINITNTSTTATAIVHLFFVQSTDCTSADNFICLTANQTASFLTSDVDPNTSGFIVAVASDSRGCPAPFNFLIGDEYVKTPTHAANLGAEAFAALFSSPVCPASSDVSSVALFFNGTESTTAATYNQAPRVLALDNFASPADGNNTILIINSVGGDLGGTVPNIGQIFMIVYDDAENPGSATLNLNNCQRVVNVNNAGIRTAPPLSSLVPSGRSGWLKFNSPSGRALLGAAINANTETGFSGGHNLHKLTLTATTTLTIPVFAPQCGD